VTVGYDAVDEIDSSSPRRYGDMMIQTLVRRDVNTEQTNMATDNSSVSTKLKYRIPATQHGTLKCFFLSCQTVACAYNMPIIRQLSEQFKKMSV